MSDFENNATLAESLGLDHLRAFIAVVETRSQVLAAKRLKVAQGTISRHVERVAAHFGGGLFEAGGSGSLTTRGLLVEQSARSVLAELTRTRERLSKDNPVLRLGFIRAARPLVARSLRGQTESYGIPRFEVRLFELSSEAQARALVRRELDIAIAYATPELAERPGIEASLVAEEPYALVLPEHAWVRKRPAIAALRPLVHARVPRTMSERGAQAVDRWLLEHELEPASSIECAVGSEIVAYASSGYGYGFLPALWSMGDQNGAVFAPLPDFTATAKIAAYSLAHVTPWITRLRENLGVAARTALDELRAT